MNAAKKTVLLVLVSLLPLSLCPAIRAAESSEGLKVHVEYDSFGAHVVTDLEIATNVWREGGNVTATATCSSHYMPGSLPGITEPVDTGIWQFTVALLLGEAEIVSYSPPLTGMGRVNKWSEGCSVVWELPQGDPKALYPSGTTFTATIHLGTHMPGREPSIAAFAHGADQDKWAKLALRIERDIVIDQNGSIDPLDAPISRKRDVFTLTDDIERRVRVYRSNCVIDGNGHTISQVDTGLHLEARNVTIKNLMITHCDLGIDVSGGGGHTLLNNTVDRNQRGILVQTSSGNLLSGNTARFNTLVGLHLNASSENVLTRNLAYNNSFHSIVLTDSHSNRLSHNVLTYNPGWGIYLFRSDDNALSENEGRHNGFPLYVNQSSRNILTRNELRNNSHAIYLASSLGCTLSDNRAENNVVGIVLDLSNLTLVSGNYLKDNIATGISVGYAADNTILSNILIGNDITLGVASRNLISGNNLSQTYSGLLMHSSDSNKIVDNHLDNGRGIVFFSDCSHNEISGNVLVGTDWADAISISDSEDNLVVGNQILDGPHDVGTAIVLLNCSATTVVGNTVMNMSRGIHLWGCGGNRIYHNAFITRTIDGFTYNCTENSWDNGYPSGGNYWGQYAGADRMSGANQDVAGKDGLGDTPCYLRLAPEFWAGWDGKVSSLDLDPGNYDRYPLMGRITRFGVRGLPGDRSFVDISSSSTITGFSTNARASSISFSISGDSGTQGFCRASIPRDLMWCDRPEEWGVKVDGQPVGRTVAEGMDSTDIYFEYVHSAHEVSITSTHSLLPSAGYQFADPADDLFNSGGQPTTGDPYLDIVGVDVALEGSTYVARIDLLGSFPASLADSSVYIEWDLLIDSDRNPNTRSWGPWALLDNGLGVDVVARINMGSSGYAGQALTWPGGKTTTQSIDFKLDGMVAELRFDASLIGNPAAFDYVVAVRKNVKNQMTAADKCPNDGHATAPVDEQKEAFMVALVGLLVAAAGTTRIRGPDGCSTEETSWPET